MLSRTPPPGMLTTRKRLGRFVDNGIVPAMIVVEVDHALSTGQGDSALWWW